MARVIAPITSLLISVVLLLLGHGLQSTIIPLAARSYHFQDFMIGLAASAYFVGYVVGAMVTPHVVVRAGHIRGFAVMVSSMSAAALLHPLVTDAQAWILFRFITGFSISGLYLIIESWLNEFADNSNRGVVMSVYIVVNFAAFTGGQLMATLTNPESFYLFAIASIIISVAVMPVAMTKSAQPAPIAIVKLELGKVFRTSQAAIVAAFIIGMVVGAHLTFAPIYAVEMGYDARTQAPIFAATLVAGGVISQWPIGRYSDRMDRRLVLLFISVLGIFFSIGITLVPEHNFLGFVGMGLLIGAVTQPAYSLAAAHGYDHAKENGYVRMAAGLLVSFGLGSSLGPFATSLIMQQIGPNALFLFPAVLLAILSIYLGFRIVHKDAVEEKYKEDFDLASTAATAGAVVSPELLNEEDRYVVVPDSWEPSEAEPEDEDDGDGEGSSSETSDDHSDLTGPDADATETIDGADVSHSPEAAEQAHQDKDEAEDEAKASDPDKPS